MKRYHYEACLTINGASTEPPMGCSRGRLHSEYTVGYLSEGLPVSGSRRRILMPPQKLPQFSQTLSSFSTTRLGSMAFQSSLSWKERSTMPSSFQLYLGSPGSSVGLVASPIAELRLPKVERA